MSGHEMKHAWSHLMGGHLDTQSGTAVLTRALRGPHGAAA